MAGQEMHGSSERTVPASEEELKTGTYVHESVVREKDAEIAALKARIAKLEAARKG